MKPTGQEMSNAIDALAARWASRLDRGELSDAERQALDAWLAADRRHLGAFARARAVSVQFDRAKALRPALDPGGFRGGLSSGRGSHLRGWIAGVAVASLLVFSVVLYWQYAHDLLATRIGEVRRVPLIDGSAVTLNTDTRLDVQYSKAERTVKLLQGEALFNVAHDRARPFIVQAGTTEVRAIGTSFTVRRLPGEKVQVVVREGVVEVSEDRSPSAVPLRLSAQNRAIVAARSTPALATVSADQIDHELAWQEGMISLDGRTLAEAASEFRRYSQTNIVFDDPAVAGETVTGLFAANDPEGFARAVATSMNLKVDVRGNAVKLTR